MEMTKTYGFSEMTSEDMYQTEGGVFGLGLVLFSIGKISVTIGMCLKAGAAIGLVAGGAVVLSR